MKNSLLKIFGEKGASEKEADKMAYSSDASEIGGKAECVVWPSDYEQLRQLVLFAKRTKTMLTPRGGGIGLCGGATPKNSIIIDMSSLNNIVKIEDETVIVQAGVTPKALNDSLSSSYFPILPIVPAASTFGGMIAVNIQNHKGKVSDYILELKVVDGTGKLMAIKGAEILNFAGKEGKTGVIVEAKIRLERKSLMEKESLTIFSFNTISPMLKKVNELASQPNAVRVEFLDETCSVMAGLDRNYHLLVGFNDDSGNIKEKGDVKMTWMLYDELYKKLLAKRLTTVLDPKLDTIGMDKFLYWLQKNGIPSYGSLGRGVVFPHFKHKDSKIEQAIEVAKQFGAAFGQEHGFGLLKKGLETEKAKREMKELKLKYDSGFIMNGGKEE